MEINNLQVLSITILILFFVVFFPTIVGNIYRKFNKTSDAICSYGIGAEILMITIAFLGIPSGLFLVVKDILLNVKF